VAPLLLQLARKEHLERNLHMAHKLRMVGPANKVRKVHKVYKVRMERILLVADKKLVDYRRLPSF
jgi:hypothetical protein